MRQIDIQILIHLNTIECNSGNLVTNYNFEHFWLNEGFTVFTERKIVGRLGGGEPARAFAVSYTG